MCLQPVVLWSALWHSPGFPLIFAAPGPSPGQRSQQFANPVASAYTPQHLQHTPGYLHQGLWQGVLYYRSPLADSHMTQWIKKKSREVTIFLTELAWRRPGDKPLFEPKMVSLLMHINASLSLNELKRQSGYFFPFKKARKDIFFNVLHILLFENKQSKLLIDSKFPEHWNITKLY